MKVMLDPGAYPPLRAHDTDAGLDIRSREEVTISPGARAIVSTGTHVQLPEGTCGLLVSKSGLNLAWGIVSTGLIDENYSGEIMVALDNHGSLPYTVHAGDKVSQLVVLPCRYEEVELVTEIPVVGRGNAGFGSTGR